MGAPGTGVHVPPLMGSLIIAWCGVQCWQTSDYPRVSGGLHSWVRPPDVHRGLVDPSVLQSHPLSPTAPPGDDLGAGSPRLPCLLPSVLAPAVGGSREIRECVERGGRGLRSGARVMQWDPEDKYKLAESMGKED